MIINRTKDDLQSTWNQSSAERTLEHCGKCKVMCFQRFR